MHIEIIGPPGAGKSTLVNELSKYTHIEGGTAGRNKSISRRYHLPYESYNTMIVDRLDRLINSFWHIHTKNQVFIEYSKSNPKFCSTVFSLLNELDRDDIDYNSRYINAIAKTHVFEKYCDHTCIVDEGIVHYAATAQELPKIGSQYVDLMPKFDFVLVLDAPSEICFERQEKRSQGRASFIENNDYRSAIEMIQHQQSLVDTAVDEMSRRGFNVLRLDATKEISQLVEETLSSISTK